MNYWATEYDWRQVEARLNALPQFRTEIDGLDIHFLHVRSPQPNALPLIVSHGWPGSIIEQLKIIEPLTNPTAHGASASDAFDVMIPSLPGYGFSGKPAATGWGPRPHRPRLGGADGSTRLCPLRRPGRRLGHRDLGRAGPPGTRRTARHPHQLRPDGPARGARSHPQRRPSAGQPLGRGTARLGTGRARHLYRGYGVIQGTRPQTIGYSLADTPVGLAAWLLDHDTASYEHLAQLFAGQPFGAITRDDVLDNTSLYWFTNTATSAARLYWEQGRAGGNFYAAADLSLPAAVTVFPEEYVQAPRSWTERAYHNLIYFNEAATGGHFAAWEQPQLFSEELRAAFRSLR